MRKYILLFLWIFTIPAVKIHSQIYSVKTNVLALATTTFNAEIGFTNGNKLSFHLPIYYNPWIISDDYRLQQLSTLPGIRYWFKEAYRKYYIGLYGIATRYHIGGFGQNYRYDGTGYGAGLSVGYSKILHKHWNIDFELGAGILYSEYDKFYKMRGSEMINNYNKLLIIPTRAEISFVYLF